MDAQYLFLNTCCFKLLIPILFVCYLEKINAAQAFYSYLSKHIDHVHEKITFTCIECNKQFSQKGNLSSHIKIVHEMQKPYKCHTCYKYFSNKRNMSVHISTVHEKLKEFKCNNCEMKDNYYKY